jgi:mannosyl-oligosaccharide glucosidase
MKKNRFVFFSSHWCDQNDHLKYEWTYHDGEKFGIEDIKDDNLQLNIQWIKQISGKHGGDWTTRIHVTPQV